MHLSIYVGPYYLVPKGFDWWDWDGVVSEGRGESGVGDEKMVLIPNCRLEGVDRVMGFETCGETPILNISAETIIREKTAFEVATVDLRKHFVANDIEVKECWGVVPRWS